LYADLFEDLHNSLGDNTSDVALKDEDVDLLLKEFGQLNLDPHAFDMTEQVRVDPDDLIDYFSNRMGAMYKNHDEGKDLASKQQQEIRKLEQENKHLAEKLKAVGKVNNKFVTE